MIENEPPIEIIKKEQNVLKVIIVTFVVITLIFVMLVLGSGMLENRKLANEKAAKALLQRIIDAQASYRTKNQGIYADSLSRLVDSKFLQEDAFTAITQDGETAMVQGYIFTQQGFTTTSWTVVANPIDANTGTKVFMVDATGNITFVVTGN